MSKPASRKERVIAGLDIGTSKIALMVAVARPEGLDIVGLGASPSVGLRQGAVVNIESTVEAIRKAREEAELMSGHKLSEIWLGVSGNHIQSFDSKGMIAIRNKEVTQEDIKRVLEAAKTVNVPDEREVLHVLPRGYRIDDQEGIHDPIGMSGVRLEANVHIVTGSKSAIQNLIKCCDRAELKVKGLVLQPLASALSVLTEDEQKLGVCLVDIGGGTSDLIVYTQGSAAFSTVVPVGGHHFTHDVAVGLRTPQSCAEKIKKEFGSALSQAVEADEMIDVEGVGGRNPRSVSRRVLAEVLEPRADETLTLIRKKLDQNGWLPHLGSGFVLTGGAASLHGFAELAEYVFEAPVRVGIPEKVRGLKEVAKNPSMATAVGILLYAAEHDHQPVFMKQNNQNAFFAEMTQKLRDLLGGTL